MKIEFKQSFAIDRYELKIKKKGVSVIAEVPAYFLFISFFVSMLKENLVKVLELSHDELDEEEMKEYLKNSEPDPLVVTIVENLLMEEDEDEESQGEPNEEHSNSSSESVPSESVNPESEPASEEPKSEQGEAAEQVEQPKKLSADEKEFEMLEEKKLRLTNKEKKRHAELKAKLKG